MTTKKPAASETGDPLLLTPGPLTTSASVKQAMVHDWGSRDAELPRASTGWCWTRSSSWPAAQGTHVTVPVQGSGTFAVEAMITTFVPQDRQAPGADQRRLWPARQEDRRDRRPRRRRRYETPEDTPPDLARLETMLADDKAITHVFAVHCETTSGILNPIAEIAAIVARHGRRLLVDSMSAFGALEIDARKIHYDALAASSNKCLEGVPGLGFVVCRNDGAGRVQGQRHHPGARPVRPGRGLRQTGQYRFTPPIHVIVALRQGDRGARGRGRRRRPRQALPRQCQGADRRHARAWASSTLLPERAAGADHRHLPHADRSEVRLPALL